MAEVSSYSSSSEPRNYDFEMADRKDARFQVGEKPAESRIGGAIEDNDAAFEGTKSSADDQLDMQRLGKKQQLIVRCDLYPYWMGNRLSNSKNNRDTFGYFLQSPSWPWRLQLGRSGYSSQLKVSSTEVARL